MSNTDLSDKMRELAARDPDHASELLNCADAFDTAVKGFYAEPQTHSVKQMVGAWARARRVWCECTGETLI